MIDRISLVFKYSQWYLAVIDAIESKLYKQFLICKVNFSNKRSRTYQFTSIFLIIQN